MNEARELRGIRTGDPQDAGLDDYVFVPMMGPLDADEWEWLANALWDVGLNTPDDELPDDTMIQHARLVAARMAKKLTAQRVVS